MGSAHLIASFHELILQDLRISFNTCYGCLELMRCDVHEIILLFFKLDPVCDVNACTNVADKTFPACVSRYAVGKHPPISAIMSFDPNLF